MRSNRFLLSMAAVLVLSLAGCDSQENADHRVSGEVTFAGEPVTDGYIVFQPADQEGARASARIKEGRYSVMLRKGPRRVEITANRTVPGKEDELGMPLIKQYIPDRYNTSSELTSEITAATDRLDFQLKAD